MSATIELHSNGDVADKMDTKEIVTTAGSSGDLESDQNREYSNRKAGSLWTIIGCVRSGALDFFWNHE